MDHLLTLSGSALAKKIREGELTSAAVVEAHIRRIEQVNPIINAVAAPRFDQARAEARAADLKTQRVPLKQLPPFHGVPCTIKECFAVPGMPNTAGLVARIGLQVDTEAPAVARLRAAGAILLGVTNLSELCMWMESDNRVYGRTNNPYNPGRIVGGSSGGEGSIIGAGGSPFGLGSDIGGSIRMPAFFNGVFGHKPSAGLVPVAGQFPIASNEARRYLTTGPLARRAEDLWPLLNILAGPDGEDKYCEAIKLGDPYHISFSKLKVVVIENNGKVRVTRDMQNALRAVADRLVNLGVHVTTAKVEKLRYSRDIWSASLQASGGPSFSELLGNGQPIDSFAELGRWLWRKSDHTLPAIALTLLEKLNKLLPKRNRKFVEMGRELRQELTELIGPDGVLLYPSYPSVAPPHYQPLFHPFNFTYTAILNIMEFPVTQVPLGLNAQGLPLGVQVAAIHGHDHLTIGTALALEKEFGGWTPPEL